MEQKTFFIIAKGSLVVKNCLRPRNGDLNLFVDNTTDLSTDFIRYVMKEPKFDH